MAKKEYWIVWIVLFLVIIIVLWVFFGGGEYEFIGLTDGNKVTTEPEEASSELLEKKPSPTFHGEYSQPSRADRFRSKGETICRQVMEQIYQRPFPSCRPNFLRNPETGHNLELDGYNKHLNIAFEYNGAQHYKFPNRYHRTHRDFIQQLRRDRYKVETCRALGIYLIIIPYHVPYYKIRQHITERLPTKHSPVG